MWRMLSIAAVTAFLLADVLASAIVTGKSDSSQDLGWKAPAINTKVWQRLPGEENLWGQPPSTGLAVDPYIYEFRLACVAGDQAMFPACSAALPKCTESGDGTAVYWYRAVNGVTPLNWTFDSGPSCIYGEKPRDVLAEIADRIASEFQKTPVAPAVIGIQPGFHTLRGRDTNFYAEAHEQGFDLDLLGQQVHITAMPVAYTWDYGDGSTWGPTELAGYPLPDDRVGEQTRTSHAYAITGRLAINLTTHFNGSYTVNGGPELPIPGQGNIGSEPHPLTVWRAITRNYADDCFVNPEGVGC